MKKSEIIAVLKEVQSEYDKFQLSQKEFGILSNGLCATVWYALPRDIKDTYPKNTPGKNPVINALRKDSTPDDDGMGWYKLREVGPRLENVNRTLARLEKKKAVVE